MQRINDIELLQHLEDLAFKKVEMIKSEFSIDSRIIFQQEKIKALSDKLAKEQRTLYELLDNELKNNKAMMKKNKIFIKKYLKFKNKKTGKNNVNG